MLSSAEVKQAALAVGFDDCGIARADALTDDEYPLREWLRRGWNGDLDYMERNIDKRMDPRLLVPGAKSVICLVSAYPPPDELPPCGQNPEIQRENGSMDCHEAGGKVAAYAKHRDYHKDIKQMLFALRERLGIDGKCCCDTVPISDKHWAVRAGLGWIGRHTLLVTKKWGSWVNLGEIVTTAECSEYDSNSLSSNTPSKLEGVPVGRGRVTHLSPCTTCGRCVEACPNQALAPDGPPMMDVRRCTAYYTTHHPRPMPPDLDAHGYTLGCDLCQLACPFNRPSTK